MVVGISKDEQLKQPQVILSTDGNGDRNYVAQKTILSP